MVNFYISVVLLDTTQESSLAWHQYPQGPHAQTPGVCVITTYVEIPPISNLVFLLL